MRIESEIGDESDDGNGERRTSLEVQIEINMKRSAERRASLRRLRLQKKRQSNPPAIVRQDSAEAEEVHMDVCACACAIEQDHVYRPLLAMICIRR